MAPQSERTAAALAHACQEPGRFDVVNLGSDHPVALNELIGVLGQEMGVEPVVEQLGSEPRTPFREGIRKFVGCLGAG